MTNNIYKKCFEVGFPGSWTHTVYCYLLLCTNHLNPTTTGLLTVLWVSDLGWAQLGISSASLA